MANQLIAPTKVSSGSALATVTAGNVSYSGNSTAGLTLLYTSPVGGSGSQMKRLRARPIYASGSTAFPLTQAQLFKVDTNGNKVFDDDAAIPAQTLGQSGGTPSPTSPADFGYTNQATRELPAGWSWYVGIGSAWSPGVAFSGDITDY